MSGRPSVMVIIPHWNRREDLRRCLWSLGRQCYPQQTLVVDNASSDGSAEMVGRDFPSCLLYRCERNLGFAGATNIGLQSALEAGLDYALLLNNDTVSDPAMIQQLVRFAEEDPARGIVAPNVYLLDAPERLWSAGGEIALARCHCRQLTESSGEPRRVDYASGCALLVSAAVIERVGLLDPRFFMYFEEVDWCLRARRAGFEIWHVPQAKVWHAVSGTLGEASAAVHYYMNRNRLLLMQKNLGFPAALRVMSSEYLRALLVAKLRGERTRARALWMAMADFVSQRFGERPPASLSGSELE